MRYWIIDNSGSMQRTDGHYMVSTSNNKPGIVKMVPCSRWEEIVDCVEYHIKLAGLIQAPTRFRLLNDPGATVGRQQFSIAEDENSDTIAHDVQDALRIMKNARPGGCTPLTDHLQEIYKEVSQMTPEFCDFLDRCLEVDVSKRA